MSLFQVREWWTAKSDNEEEYSYGGLAVGNIDNDTANHAKIITGSLNGKLRVYFPAQQEYKIEHLLLEEDLCQPILQVSIGYFLPNQPVLALAVLHPYKLGVYSVDAVGGSGLGASYYKLSQRYEHMLGHEGKHFTAFNMIYGAFGQYSTRSNQTCHDNICVQSLDGQLQFFYQDRLSFLQNLNSSLIPAALAYSPDSDTLIASTSDLQLECYKYQELANASIKDAKLIDQSILGKSPGSTTKSNMIHIEWKRNIGEPVLEIHVGRCYNSEDFTSLDIIVLGETGLFVLNQLGDLIVQMRLVSNPSTMFLYPRMPNVLPISPNAKSQAMDNILIANYSKLWTVFRENTVVWSALSATVPVALHVAEFGGIRGQIVSLDSDGTLSINYLGTDPPSTSVTTPESNELNYEEMDEEHRRLLNVIRRSQTDRKLEPKDKLILRVQIPACLDAISDSSEVRLGASALDTSLTHLVRDSKLTVRIYVTYIGTGTITNITLSIYTPSHIVADQTSVSIASLDGKSSTPLIIPIQLKPNAAQIPTSSQLRIVASYVLETGQPRLAQITSRLPLCISCRLVPPVKSSTFKFTLETNQSPVDLSKLFDDLLNQPFCTNDWIKQIMGMGNGASGNSSGAGVNVMSFQYYNGVEATIIVSKNAGRYRIQSSDLEALWFVSNELVLSLQQWYASSNAQGKLEEDAKIDINTLEVSYREPLPLADFFAAIDTHFQLRQQKQEMICDLNDRAHEFRIIQKRLLSRYKDRNPTPINCLDVLSHGTYDQILQLSQQMDTINRDLSIAANRLSCCIQLVLMLIRYRFQLDANNHKLLESYLSPFVSDDESEQGWEERTNAAMIELLRNVLVCEKVPNVSDNEDKPIENDEQKEDITIPQSSNNMILDTHNGDLQLPNDTKKLKKHITLVCDRLAKGGKIITSNVTRATKGQSNKSEK